MYQFGGEENFRGPGTFPGMEQGNTPEINFMTPEGIDYAKFLEYLRSQGVSDISEIMGGGTPGENDLVIDGPDRDSPLAQIYASIIGRAEGVDPAVLTDEQMRVLNNSGIGVIAEQIDAAGGYDEWLAQQDLEGPPEELPTELEEVVSDIDEDTTLEDEIGVDPDMPIDIPLPTLPPRESEGDGEGDGEGGTGQETTGELPDYSDIGDPDYGYPDGLPRQGSGGTIDDYRINEPGLTVGIGIPSISSGGDGGGGGGGGGGMLRTASKFTPYMGGINYQLPQDQMILYRPPTANEILTDFTNGLVRQRGMLV